jgi:esterase/lipase
MKIKDIQDDITSVHPIGFDDPIKARNMMRTAARKIMARYMSSIYSMTTVNHDHLFATLLKYLRKSEISIDEFRNRAFLAATSGLERYGIYRHRCMDTNQISLLTDDRYRKLSNFLSVATDRELDIDQQRLLIDSSWFDGDADFHRVRIDNPVSVIVNEIEPLEELQARLKQIAHTEKKDIKNDIARKLEEKMVFSFERDYANHYIEGESKERDVGRPFVIKSTNANSGMVLVHGYMATPMEVKAMAQYFGNLGYWVCVPRLKGHGTSPEDLAGRKHMEWVESVEEAYAIVKNQCNKIVVGGFSTGAGLALDLCTRVDDVSAVIAVSPPLKLQNFSARFVPAVNLWNRLMEKLNFESAKKEFVENQPENRHINYVRNPISGLMELERLMDALADKLKQIDVPAMVIQGYGDPVVDPHGSQQVFERLGSEEKEYLLINAGRHGIINGDKAWRVFQAVELFLERVL